MRSVGVLIFLVVLVSMALIVGLLGYSNFRASRSIIENQASVLSRQTIALATDKLNLMLSNYDDISAQMNGDDQFNKMLAGTTDADEEVRYASREALRKMLVKYFSTDSDLQSLSLVPVEKGMIPVTTVSGTGADFDGAQPWVQSIIQQDGATVWLDTRQGGYMRSTEDEFVFGYGKLLKSGFTEASVDYLLIVEIKEKAIAKILENVKLSDSSKVYVLNRQFENLYAPDVNEIGKKSDFLFSPDKDRPSRSAKMKVRNQPYLITYHHSNLTGWYVLGTVTIAELLKETKQIKKATLLMALLAAIIAVVAAFLLAARIGGPLNRLRRLMNLGSQGDLSVRAAFRRKDEIGQVGDSFNQMMEQITHLIQKTSESAKGILQMSAQLTQVSRNTALSSREISQATEQIASGASTLALEAREGSEKSHIIAEQVENVVSANDKMSDAADHVKEVSGQGELHMAELIEKTSSVETMTQSMVQKVDHLKENTSSIRQILDVLASITKQTNILSLNAAIEAARAGAAGKGFMVVADEIRKLANQSRQSIAIVGEITESIQSDIDETVELLVEAYPIFNEQVASVKKTEGIFNKVHEQMGVFIEQMSSITDSVYHLNESQRGLQSTLGNVRVVSEEASASTEQVAALSQQQQTICDSMADMSGKLDELAGLLSDSLRRFRY